MTPKPSPSAPIFTYLEWHDAHSNAGWFSKEEVEEWMKCEWIIREAGWIIEENNKFIVFATSHKPADEWTDEKFGQLHKIPKTWIRKRKAFPITPTP